ncbi:MAG: RNA polymerase sigma factor [Lachnospiraceae bacterium]|nr:RNA polymerase sigma factor [Lachnospiraceae bacterium]
MTEEALVRQLKEGDKPSFDLLYEKYKNLAFHTAYLITGDLPGSEDVVQDTFVKVWLHCRELKDDSGFKAWMMQILVRTAYKSGKKKSRELPDEDVLQKADRGQGFSFMEQVIAREEAEMIAGAVRALPIKQRTVVVLYYYQEYRISEIAAMLGVLEGTVKSRLHSARKMLRGSLTSDPGMMVREPV